MRRILTAITATALALSVMAQATPAQAAVPGYLSSYFGESAFLNLQQGSTGQFVAIFTNTGGTGWLKNSASQVNLGVCLSDKTTCNVTSPNAAWNDGSWVSNIAEARIIRPRGTSTESMPWTERRRASDAVGLGVAET